MKLKNKKTGEIRDFIIKKDKIQTASPIGGWEYTSLAKLNAEWEDYEEPKKYWFIDAYGNIVQNEITKHYGDEYTDMTYAYENQKQIGNYFETEEEAEKAVEKLKAWKRLKDKGFKITGWEITPDMKQIEGNYVKIEAEVPQILINEKDLDLLFGGEE